MPIPENMTVINPTLAEVDPMALDRDGELVNPDAPSVRVKILQTFAHAYGGVRVVRYVKDQVCDVSPVCAERGADDKNLEVVDDSTKTFDPRKDKLPKPPVGRK